MDRASKPPRHTSSSGHAALVTEEHTASTLANLISELQNAVSTLTTRIENLETIERRHNVPMLLLLSGILGVLVYIAHRLP